MNAPSVFIPAQCRKPLRTSPFHEGFLQNDRIERVITASQTFPGKLEGHVRGAINSPLQSDLLPLVSV